MASNILLATLIATLLIHVLTKASTCMFQMITYRAHSFIHTASALFQHRLNYLHTPLSEDNIHPKKKKKKKKNNNPSPHTTKYILSV
ncbi:hypothetical protein BO85DRAFT_266932 [Aspergillus piperis CBS 112811]|uniref:Secreted protein n=1 Tax=Aspergillus piperis CBS 112811 TaxID=1448313 RepID=A0A8G1R4R6_9EURO|nr:hypothetical protein BO85DRAFT_266932 [Aspergillus piperis CBS 112811]RAH59253.1 hypothetical protein BO85DRAFT_266932 [Aspergillus piperis CBS 112811]